MSVRPKLVASDIGGTLSVQKYMIPPFTTGVLNRLSRSGVPVALATGYNCRTALAFTQNLDDTIYLLVQNGAACIHDRSILWEYFLPEEITKDIYGFLTSRGSPVFLYKGVRDDFRNYHVAAAGIEKGGHYILVDELSNFTDTLGVSTLIPNRDISRVSEGIDALHRGELKIILSFGEDLSWLEVNPAAARKDLALSRLCQRIGVPMKEVVYFGDNINDLNVLEAVGQPVLVENALPEMKRIFSHVVGSVDQEGVARYLYELFAMEDERL